MWFIPQKWCNLKSRNIVNSLPLVTPNLLVHVHVNFHLQKSHADLDFFDKTGKLGRLFHPSVDEVHGMVKVTYIFCVQLQERSVCFHQVSYSRLSIPIYEKKKIFKKNKATYHKISYLDPWSTNLVNKKNYIKQKIKKICLLEIESSCTLCIIHV